MLLNFGSIFITTPIRENELKTEKKGWVIDFEFEMIEVFLPDHKEVFHTEPCQKNYTMVSGVPTKSLQPIDQAIAIRLTTYAHGLKP